MKIFYLPDLGEGLAEAEIREWYVKIGDIVKIDQPLVSMETAKAVVDVPSPYTGQIIALHGKENDIIPTGAPLISFKTEEDHVENKADQGSVVGKLETNGTVWEEKNPAIPKTPEQTNTIKAMPAARLIAKENKIDLSKVKGTGPQGLITAEDVRNYVQTSHSPLFHEQGEPLHGVRRIMAQTMMKSHEEIVPVTLFEDADMSAFTSETDISVRLLKAIVAAVQAEPSLNAWFNGKTLERKIWKEVHVGLAVDTEEGLFVPVIQHVENGSTTELREHINQLKKAVNERSLSAKDMQGATITLSNFGMITGRYATPIIVPPMVAIIGCGRSRETAVVREGKLTIGRIMPLSLTFDHRAITGGEATRFLKAFIHAFEKDD